MPTEPTDIVTEARELVKTHSIVAMRVDKPYKEIRELITRLCDRLEKAEAALGMCGHCGVVFAEAIKPRCEDCPAECDEENCDAMGCART
jgi:hypothetical protein